MTDEKKPETSEKKEIIEDVTINSEFIELEAAERKIKEMERLNKELDDKIKKTDRLLAEATLRGRGFAGQKQEDPEQTFKDGAENYAKTFGRSFKNLEI